MFPNSVFFQILCTFCMIPDNNVYFPRFYTSNYVFPLHFPSLNYTIYLILHLIFLFSEFIFASSKAELATPQYNLPKLNVEAVSSCIAGSRFNGNSTTVHI